MCISNPANSNVTKLGGLLPCAVLFSFIVNFERNLSSKSLVKEENCKNEFFDF